MREAVRNLDRLLHIQECMDNINEIFGTGLQKFIKEQGLEDDPGRDNWSDFFEKKIIFYLYLSWKSIIFEVINLKKILCY